MLWQKWKAWFHRVWTDRPLPVGTRLGSYRITSILGLGSYGIAYLAVEEATGELYVLKQVKPSLRRHPKGPAMQHYEAQVLRSLSHPRIPQVKEQFEQSGHYFLVMTYMTGSTVEDLLFENHREYPQLKALQLVMEIAEIVLHLHQRGIIHRDVRIPNVILREGKPYLIDFGLARFLGDPATYESDTVDNYPLEKQIKRRVEPASDLYALGHFLLFLLYSTYEASPDQEERSWEEELSIPGELRSILRRLLQLDPPYANVEEFLAEARSLLEKEKSSHTSQ
ncbi:serine/threonine protein kinase [Brevibacillus migulae]|uniref:serine/threonine protein kinase n=1 Tax=Brevibacillus migulae TaxID=1644114 RepID=UPI00106E5B9E|nr:serine/threonine-protein kinase [Brevibacillus migulae]